MTSVLVVAPLAVVLADDTLRKCERSLTSFIEMYMSKHKTIKKFELQKQMYSIAYF